MGAYSIPSETGLLIPSGFNSYPLAIMKTQLFFDLAGKTNHPKIHFREAKEIEEIMEDLKNENIAVFEIDGAALSSQEGLFKAFALALRKPKDWYGGEE